MALPHKEEGARGWSSRSVGAGWQHRFFYFLIRLGGARVAELALYFVVFYYMTVRPDQRKKTEYYLRRRFPDSGYMTRWRQSYRMSLELGRVLIDRAALGIVGSDAVSIDVRGKEELLDL
ncbi:MAG: lipid A biosynthesis acyltransferase, partial [Nitrospirota bacterium]|nr:lipid A biosynthesis acyltransferase [Nitrospirota bacterium]